MTTTRTPTAPDLAAALTIAASLVTAAAARTAPTNAHAVSMTVSDIQINIQVPERIGDVPSRTATVAAYADALDAPVQRRDSEWDSWVEAHGARSGYLIHIWTIADRKEVQPTA